MGRKRHTAEQIVRRQIVSDTWTVFRGERGDARLRLG